MKLEACSDSDLAQRLRRNAIGSPLHLERLLLEAARRLERITQPTEDEEAQHG